MNIVQCYVIQLIAIARKALHLLPTTVARTLDEQVNYVALKPVSAEADKTNLFLVSQHLKNEHLLEIQWDQLKLQLGML